MTDLKTDVGGQLVLDLDLEDPKARARERRAKCICTDPDCGWQTHVRFDPEAGQSGNLAPCPICRSATSYAIPANPLDLPLWTQPMTPDEEGRVNELRREFRTHRGWLRGRPVVVLYAGGGQPLAVLFNTHGFQGLTVDRDSEI